MHPRLRGTNLVIRYGFPEGSCVIPKKAAYMYDDTWTKVVKMVAHGIRKMKVSNVSCVFPFSFSIYKLSISVSPNSLQMIYYFPKWWSFLTYYIFKYHVNVTDALVFFAE